MNPSTEQQVFETLYARRSVRVCHDQPVERESIIKLLQAAMAAADGRQILAWSCL